MMRLTPHSTAPHASCQHNGSSTSQLPVGITVVCHAAHFGFNIQSWGSSSSSCFCWIVEQPRPIGEWSSELTRLTVWPWRRNKTRQMVYGGVFTNVEGVSCTFALLVVYTVTETRQWTSVQSVQALYKMGLKWNSPLLTFTLFIGASDFISNHEPFEVIQKNPFQSMYIYTQQKWSIKGKGLKVLI